MAQKNNKYYHGFVMTIFRLNIQWHDENQKISNVIFLNDIVILKFIHRNNK